MAGLCCFKTSLWYKLLLQLHFACGPHSLNQATFGPVVIPAMLPGNLGKSGMRSWSQAATPATTWKSHLYIPRHSTHGQILMQSFTTPANDILRISSIGYPIWKNLPCMAYLPITMGGKKVESLNWKWATDRDILTMPKV